MKIVHGVAAAFVATSLMLGICWSADERQRAASSSGPEVERLEKRSEQPGAAAAVFVDLGEALMQRSRETNNPWFYDRAVAAYQRALAIDPTSTDAMIGMAWIRNSQHDFTSGRFWAGKALAANSRLARAHALLGDAAVELGDYDGAFVHYQEALDFRPDLSSLSRAAHLLWLTGDGLRARVLMLRALDCGAPHAENTAWCRTQLALMLFHTGAYLPARRQAEIALRETPDHPLVLATMGRILAAEEQFDAAIEKYRRAIAFAPDHDALVSLGDLHTLLGRHDEAQAVYRRVIELHSAGTSHTHGGATHTHLDGAGNLQLARFYADHDCNLDAALREAELAWRTFKNVFVADTLAWCYYKNGGHKRAREMIALALAHHTPDAGILYHAGTIYAATGDNELARNYLSRALNLNPRFHPLDARSAAELLAKLGSSRGIARD